MEKSTEANNKKVFLWESAKFGDLGFSLFMAGAVLVTREYFHIFHTNASPKREKYARRTGRLRTDGFSLGSSVHCLESRGFMHCLSQFLLVSLRFAS